MGVEEKPHRAQRVLATAKWRGQGNPVASRLPEGIWERASQNLPRVHCGNERPREQESGSH